LPSHREWEGDRLKDIKFLDRINYESDDENDGEVEGDKNMREYTLTKSKRSGGGECLNLSNQDPSQKSPPSLPTTTPQESRKRYRENDGHQIKLQSGQLPQKDYELKGEEHVGREMVRKFKEGTFRGVVTGTEIDKENGDELWVIECEDGDREDMNHLELMKFLLPEKEKEDDWEEETPMAGIVGNAGKKEEGGHA
jgi:hypothetical protein